LQIDYCTQAKILKIANSSNLFAKFVVQRKGGKLENVKYKKVKQIGCQKNVQLANGSLP
jgi:hypothetical protein